VTAATETAFSGGHLDIQKHDIKFINSSPLF
jgi:hypothetical protein